MGEGAGAMLQVAAGGAVGAVLRLVLVRAVGAPLGTMVVNVAGSFAIGLLAALFAHRGGQALAPFLVTGVLGGFTTFSAFSLDALTLWERGQAALAAGYVAASVGLALLAAGAGIAAGRAAFA